MDDIKQRAEVLLQKLDPEEKNKKIAEIESLSMDPLFWKDNITASEKMKELAKLQKELEDAQKIKKMIEARDLEGLSEIITRLEKLLYFSNPFDKNNAIISIHAGQGGVDAMDWAAILSRMYQRFFERKGWKSEIIDEAQGEEAGIKNITISVSAEYAYGHLKGEQGVHRLVRLSPFNSDKLRHTSFALVEALPEIDKVEGLDIKEDDLEWDFFRASSHGGQNVQKVSTAVRLKHLPTGITVTCQTERYQAKNREDALKLLKAKLWALYEEKRKEEEKKIKGQYKAPSWGNQIRSYVLHPYQMVKDLRTGVETSNTQEVLDGGIDVFIDAELKEN